jgi:hypothetical protein
LVAFNFYTKDLTLRDKQQAILDGTYSKQDYQDNINNITIKHAVKSLQDLSRIIIHWLNKYSPKSLSQPIYLLYHGSYSLL